jgi:hypothetical protein
MKFPLRYRSLYPILENPRIPDSELRRIAEATSVSPWLATSVVRDMAADLEDARAALRERAAYWWTTPFAVLIALLNLVLAVLIHHNPM